MYMIVRVQPTLCFAKCIQQRGVFVSVYSYMVFGDTAYSINKTSPYAFLVSINEIQFTLNIELAHTKFVLINGSNNKYL